MKHSIAIQTREVIVLLCTGVVPPQVLCAGWVPQYKKDIKLL